MRTYPSLSKAEVSSDGMSGALEKLSEKSGTRAAARAVLDGRKKGLLALLPFLGPAFIACVAYIDPGNFATNISGGSAFGYNLLWVIALANLMAMLLQTMSAKLGLATGQNLAELCRQEFRKPVVYAMWIVSEIAAMATDLAEFLGASIAINLLFGLPLLYATLITGVATYLILQLERHGFRPLEAVISALVGVIALCYVIETFFSRPNLGQVGFHTIVPWLGGAASLVFAVALLASGLSSSTVGTMAGQVIMQGFVGFTIPIWVRRVVTMIPAVIVAAIGLNPTSTLVISQVVLSFVLPLPVITLVMFTRRRDLMGTLVNKPLTTWAAIACSVIILSLNVWLLYATFAPFFGWWQPS